MKAAAAELRAAGSVAVGHRRDRRRLPPDPTHDGPNRSSDNGTAYGTRGRASRRSSGLSVGGKRKCKESKGGESREVANCHWSTFPGNRSLSWLSRTCLGPRGPTLLHGQGNRGRVLECFLPGGCWGGSKSWDLEGAGAHERLYLGIGLGLVEAIAFLHLGRETIRIADSSGLGLGDLGLFRGDVGRRNCGSSQSFYPPNCFW